MLNKLKELMSLSTYTYKDDLKTWAQLEYGKDWRFAYNFLVDNNGKPPRKGEHY